MRPFKWPEFVWADSGLLTIILWLTAIRREGEDMGFWRFLKVGALVTPPALLLTLASRLVLPA